MFRNKPIKIVFCLSILSIAACSSEISQNGDNPNPTKATTFEPAINNDIVDDRSHMAGGGGPGAGAGTPGAGAGAGNPGVGAGAGTPGAGAGAGNPGAGAGAGTPGAGAGAGTPGAGAGAGNPGVGAGAGTPGMGAGAGTPGVGAGAGAPGAGAGAPGAGAGAGTPGAGAGAGTPGAGAGAGTPGAGAGTGTPGTGVGTPAPTPDVLLPAFQYLPILSDADGNPNDEFATYNLTVDANVLVNVTTPSGSWLTPMMRYNQSQLPPVIVAKRGTQIKFNVQNNLAEETTIHWHGFKIPAIQDGGPTDPIGLNESRVYEFELVQAAAPLWFHPHPHGLTPTQVYNGLAGGFIVTDDITLDLEANKQLPSGSFDIPLLVQDRSFAPDLGTGRRALSYQPNPGTGMLGNIILVNGVQMPALSVETRQYRFRLFNGSNARTYDFALSNDAIFKLIGTDGGLLAQPVDVDHIMLSAGERAEVIVDFSAYTVGGMVTLVSRAFTGGGMAGGTMPNGAAFDVMRFDIDTAVTDDILLYANLPSDADIYNRLTEAQASVNRNFVMSMGGMGAGGMQFVINGKSFDINRVDEFVLAGATEIWTISNTSMMAHPFHAHAIQWQVLDRNNLPPVGADLGWKDTVLVQPGETVRFIGRFDPIVNIGKYMYHCHILEHEEAGMMGIFEIQPPPPLL